MYESEIVEIYRKCNIRDFPIDCYAIVKALGFTLVSYGDLAKNHEEYKLLCLCSGDAFTSFDDMMICYNQKNSRRRIRFNLMHEIGHYVLQTSDEDEADAFASGILAPPAVIIDRRFGSAEKISIYFDISIAAANHALIGSFYYDRSAGEQILDHFRPPLDLTELMAIPIRPEISIKKREPSKRQLQFEERTAWLSKNYPRFADLAFIERDLDAFFPAG